MPFTPPQHHHFKPIPPREKPLPWIRMMIVVAGFFLMGVIFVAQEYGEFFMGAIIGEPKYLLQDISCPTASFAFETSPIPQLFSYQKGNTEFNRKEMLRINEKNYGLTAWFSYDKSFQESKKAELIDKIAYERNPHQYLVNLYQALQSDQNTHAAADFVTKWLSENPNLPTVFPYSTGVVVDAVSGHPGYGNYVSVCSDLTDGSKKLRVLYNVAHLDSISVTAGQTVTAGTELGKIGSTGKSTTPHAHIAITPDLLWITNYREVYNAGYKFYYPTNVRETLVKTIDPISVLLNPDMAYSIVLDDEKRKQVFSNADIYIQSISNLVAFNSSAAMASVLPVPIFSVFSGFRITASPERVIVAEPSTITVEALDQTGSLFQNFQESVQVVLSSPTAKISVAPVFFQGKTNFQVTDTIAGDLLVQVSNLGAILAEKRIGIQEPAPAAAEPVTISEPASSPVPPPAPIQVFTDVVEGSVDAEIFDAVRMLKEAGVIRGNPDGSFGLTDFLNRASAVTLLIRAFYTDVNLEALNVKKMNFKDVPKTAWYAPAIWYASQSRVDGEQKPVILKGYQGKAQPEANVKLEEFLTMILRVLDITLPKSTPWYDSALKKSIELGLIVEADRQLLDQPLPRGMVAKILVKAINAAKNFEPKNVVSAPQSPGTSASSLPVIRNLRYDFAVGSVFLAFESDFSGPFVVSRTELETGDTIVFPPTTEKIIRDGFPKIGASYRYQVSINGDPSQSAEIYVNL